MSRFVCDVQVFRDGACKSHKVWNMICALNTAFSGLECQSNSLVPGDIVNLIEPHLTTVPADMFLLSGDAIVNESMLTGESVPVSKMPAKDDDLLRWRNSKDISGDSAKSFLYAGTRVVRIRSALTADGGPGRPALGLVVRTGELINAQTAKGIATDFRRFLYNQGRAHPINVISQANGLQVLPRLDQVYSRAHRHRGARLPSQCCAVRASRSQ